ncbi:hypothetical protein F5884DRAFT_891482 [Xylogone sp. PMI_703]|nr:hypothetical protein F5884DRAFT_891482 [Xylogone sp. PMI_703]
MSGSTAPVLVTGAAGQTGGVGRRVVELLRSSGVPVRSLVRRDDERAMRLRDIGAEVVIADLTKLEEVFPALQGCRRVFFSMSVSSHYLEATAVMAAAARATASMELLVNIESPQHRLQWLSEQVLNWSGLPVAHLRPTVFQENPLFWTFAPQSIEKSGSIRMPFGNSRTSPVAARDVAEVAVKILLEPSKYVGKILEITGPRSVNMDSLADEYSTALGRPIHYVDVPLQTWRDESLEKSGLPEHVYHHILTMAKLHAAGRYDRCTNLVKEILGRPAAALSATIMDGHNHFPIAPNTPLT